MAKLRGFGGIVLAVVVIGCAAVWFLGGAGPIASSPSSPPLVLERTISLGMVKGRIDHLAIDVARKRLFVAELGNDILAAVDLERGEVLNTVTGLREPQGVAYVPGPDLVYIASAGDGSLRWFRGDDLAPVGRLDLGGDADNIRLDGPDRIMVGYGSGGLATVDAASGRKVGDVALPAHPEGFQIDAKRNRVDVNLPDRLQVASVDRSSGRGIGRWGLTFAVGNFPMALDEEGGRLFVGYRFPSTLAVIDATTGNTLGKASMCSDADDLFYDARRKRVYASCGSGETAVYDAASATSEIGRAATRSGARTSLFVPALDRLYVAVPERGGQPAEIMIFAPR